MDDVTVRFSYNPEKRRIEVGDLFCDDLSIRQRQFLDVLQQHFDHFDEFELRMSGQPFEDALPGLLTQEEGIYRVNYEQRFMQDFKVGAAWGFSHFFVCAGGLAVYAHDLYEWVIAHEYTQVWVRFQPVQEVNHAGSGC